MSILDTTAHDIPPREHDDFEINELETGSFENRDFASTKPDPTLDPFVRTDERADTGDFPALQPDIDGPNTDRLDTDRPNTDAPRTFTSDEDPQAGRASTLGTVPAPDNHEEHSTLLIAALLSIGCLWIGITVDSLFDSLARTATSVAVFATLTLGVLVASALHDSE